MSLGKRVSKGAAWLGLFKTISQILSWIVTILVARILLPDDYGLMELGTIFTGYAAIFSELGLGTAIIQKQSSTKTELSSTFWFAIGVSVLLAASCFPMSYTMAYIFNEPRVIPITQMISIVFILNGLQIVPMNLLKKSLDFKKVGFIEMVAVLVSCSFMLLIAHLGAGVWTLVGGFIIQSLTRLILVYSTVRWIPKFSYDFKAARPYLKFGTTVALGRSLSYMRQRADRFFAGRAWTASSVGYYTFALQLSSLPTEKITVLINQVSFPAFSKLQDNRGQFNIFYLRIVKITLTLVMPLFVGAFLVAEELINVLLGNKWVSIIFIFKFLCLTQIMTSLNAVNGFVHNAQGRPHWYLYNHAASAILMSISFYFAVQHGLNAMLIPWFTTYMIVSTIWIYITLKKVGIDLLQYLRNMSAPFMATLVMLIPVIGSAYLIASLAVQVDNLVFPLILKVVSGGVFYISYLWFFDRELFQDLRKLRKTAP